MKLDPMLYDNDDSKFTCTPKSLHATYLVHVAAGCNELICQLHSGPMPQTEDIVLKQLKQHTTEIRELDIGDTPESISSPVSAADFVRGYVAGNKPCLITGALSEWPAYRDWDRDYLTAKAGETKVTVDYTPNGRGDAITTYSGPAGSKHTCFCTPLELQLPFVQFIDEYFQNENTKRVPYLQVGA